MLNLAPPQSQKAGERPIDFVLHDQRLSSGFNRAPLVIRPEDLTVAEPSRLAVQQTLGGAWIDNFGPGIATINIAGTTGWRRSADGLDGLQAFQRLRTLAYVNWHARRESCIRAGLPPSLVKLIFVDALDEFAWEVAPMSFSLKRNKARPLLMQYNMSLLVVDKNISLSEYARPEPPPSNDPDAGLDSLEETIARLVEWSEDIAELIGDTLGAVSAAILAVTTAVLDRVMTVVDGAIAVVDNIAGAFIAVAADLTAAARNVFLTVMAVTQLPDFVRMRCMQVAGAFLNAYCLLKNAFQVRRFLPDFSGLYGASACSSTSGGRPMSPYRHQNVFEVLAPDNAPQMISISERAAGSIRSLAAADPVLNPPSPSRLRTSVDDITVGLELA